MIYKNRNLILTNFEIVFSHFNDDQELISLCENYFLMEKDHWMPMTQVVFQN